MGIVLERMGRLEDALECYQKASEINPSDVWHWCNQADIMVALNRHREAIPLLEKALKQDPAHPNSWAKLGQVYRLLQDYPASIRPTSRRSNSRRNMAGPTTVMGCRSSSTASMKKRSSASSAPRSMTRMRSGTGTTSSKR
jgi:tetratricopeptide (TPR) repeat protein